MKKRKLFCELNPTCYKISLFKECRKKDLKDLLSKRKFAKTFQKENLPCLWKGEVKIIMRKLHDVDMQLQRNKVRNLELASERIDGIIVKPGEEFSFWKLVGNATKSRGYLEGLVISNGQMKTGYGGGLCQLANLIHWMVLHTPLEVTELHHHSDALFPDYKRKVPFGTGTSISYNALDYRFKNTSNKDIQIRVWVDNLMLYGELRSEEELKEKYEIEEEDSHFAKEDGIFYRNSRVYKLIINKETNEVIEKKLILKNHSKVMYDYNLIPKEEIREEK